MTISLYNTTSRKKEPFSPLSENRVSMYHCGPTVYDYAHIGNLRSFVTWDILRRVFETNGYEVRQVMNITDVDDKTIKRAREESVSLGELTRRYTDIFLSDIAALNVLTPHILPRATEHIEEMVILIEKLLERGFAYKTDDGSVYFKVSAFGAYGNFARLEKQASLEKNVRVAGDEYDKEDIRDFALWKSWNKDDKDVFWETRLGKGRPGWHIECSAMSMKYLGETFDIHTGGRDLVFPHHTNEIAQSEGATGKPFVRYWLHNEFILVDGKKMAKSEGNIVTLADIKSNGIAPLAYRYWLLTAHYRTFANFTWEALEGASNALRGLYERFDEIQAEGGSDASGYMRRFDEYVADDLDTPRAIAVLWDTLKDAAMDPEDKKASLIAMDKVLGLGITGRAEKPVPDEVLSLVEEREEARKDADWERADALRKKIEKLGFLLKDTVHGPRISPR